MLSFESFKRIRQLLEAENNTAIVSFARMNPPTIGHIKLMKKIIELGKKHNGVTLLFLSHSSDKKKNPLNYEDKFKIISEVAPKGLNVIHSDARNVFDVLKAVKTMGASKIIMIAGSDRIKDFSRFEKYIDEIGIESFEVVSSGERDPDSEGVEGVSATKLRELAKNGNYEEFKKNSACSTNDSLCKLLYNKVREGLGV